MSFAGIDEYTVERTFTESTALLWLIGIAGAVGVVVALFGLMYVGSVWKSPRRRIVSASIVLAVAATSVFLLAQTGNPDMRVEKTVQKTYLVVTGTPTWSEVVRDKDGDATELLMRVDAADEWLMTFTGSDIDALIGRSTKIRAQCAPDGERMACSTVTNVPVTKFLSTLQPSRAEWSEPVITPYRD